MTNKVYAGNGKEITTKFGKMMKISFSAEDVQKLQDNLNNGWINLDLKERREPSEKGTTHYLEVDTWKPDGDKKESTKKEVTVSDLPF